MYPGQKVKYKKKNWEIISIQTQGAKITFVKIRNEEGAELTLTENTLKKENEMYKYKCEQCGTVFQSEEPDYCPECGSPLTEDFHLNECECDECQNK